MLDEIAILYYLLVRHPGHVDTTEMEIINKMLQSIVFTAEEKGSYSEDI